MDKIIEKLPSDSYVFPAWWIWCVYAGLLTLIEYDFDLARAWYWNRKVIANPEPNWKYNWRDVSDKGVRR